MGYYLGVQAAYGLAWGHNDTPSACFPEDADGEQIENGMPVGPNGALVWGEFGNKMGNPDCYLAVAGPSGDPVADYAMRIPPTTRLQTEEWDTIIYVYLSSLGFTDDEIDHMHAPGWLALAD